MRESIYSTGKMHKDFFMKIFMIFVLIFICTIKMVAQNLEIKGLVLDSKTHEPIPGANVVVEGTSKGTLTDADGKFRITVTSQKVSLQFSFIGYITQSVPVTGKGDLNINLEEDVKTMDEVVVIGYGSTRRGDISGAISSINSMAIKDIPVASAAEAITGRIAGVQISSMDGSPDAEVIIRVRGGGSITQDNSPLLIVDGFPINNINDVSPSDIESYTVLKDASSTAIYGARGANGVVLITTKGAKSGKTTVTLNSYLQRKFFPIERKFDMLSPYEYVLSQYEYAKLRGETSTEMINYLKFYSDFEDIDIYKNIKGTDWQDEMFGAVEQYSQYYNVNVNGGSEKTQTNLSYTHNKDDGLIETSGFVRDYLTFKMNQEIFKNLKLEGNIRFTNSTTNGAGTSGGSDLRIGDIVTARPVNGLADYVDFSNSTNLDDEEYQKLLEGLILPTEKVKQDYRKKTAKSINLNAAVTWNVMKSLVFRSEFGVEYNSNLFKRYWGPLTGPSKNTGFSLPLGQRTASEGSSYRLANTLTYTLRKSIHSMNFMVGQEMNNTSFSSQDMTCIKFPLTISPERMFANFAKGEVLNQSTNVSADVRMLSWFGRANYSFMDKYIANITLRADGSTKFAPGKQWGFFPAASVAWRLSEEKFMEKLPFITDLKLRVSYGEAGNNRMDNDLWRYIYSISNSKTIGYGQNVNPYYKPGTVMPNPNLKWETTVTQNVGTDFSLFKDRLSGTVDMYYNKTKDLLIEADVPTSTSYKTQMQNIGKTSNKGLEITLKGDLVNKNDFYLSANFNIGFNRFRIDELDGNSERPIFSNWTSASDLKSADDYRIYVGSELGLMYGYVSDGFYSVDDFDSYDPIAKKYNLKAGQPVNDIATGITLRPGVMKLKDLDNDGHITTADRQVIGHAAAKHTGGFGLEASYKGFDCNMFFNWKYGFDVYNTSKIEFQARHRNDNANMLNTMNYANRFKYIDETTGELVTDLEALRTLNQNASIWSPFSTASSVVIFQSEAVEDGSYLRLNNITFGYALPKSFVTKFHIQKFRLYTTVYNAWVWTKYSGFDPEASTNRSNSSYNNLTPNVDYSSYPRSRSVTVGINVTF
jgi:TonB-dependent starch-binding outer membrane protein SusC